MTKWGVWFVLIVALAAYGCDTANGGPIGDAGIGGMGDDGGVGGTGGTAGTGGTGGTAGTGGTGGTAGTGGTGGTAGTGGTGGTGGMAGTGGTGGTAGTGGTGGTGGMAGTGGMGGMAGTGGMGGMAGTGGMGGMAGTGGMGGMAGTGGMGGTGGMSAVASSCLDLFNDGVVVNGSYPIEVNGSPLTVYCDMNTDGGGWTQLYDQDVTLGYLPTTTWAAGVNTTPPNMGQYSILNLIDEFEGVSAGFEFFIDWPADGSSFVQWEQSENPFNGRGAVAQHRRIPGQPGGLHTLCRIGFRW